MPPIRKGDGTPVAPKGISQVRTGDGRILFDGVDIPDSVEYLYDADELVLSDGATVSTFNAIVGDVDFAEDGSYNEPTFDEGGFNGQDAVYFNEGGEDNEQLLADGFDVEEPFVVALAVEHVESTASNNFYFGHPDDRGDWQLQDDNNDNFEYARGTELEDDDGAVQGAQIIRIDARSGDDRVIRDGTTVIKGDAGDENLDKMTMGGPGDRTDLSLECRWGKFLVADFESDSDLDSDDEIDQLLDDWADQYETPQGWS